MLACLPCSPDPLPQKNLSFGSHEAFLLLQKCSNFRQLKQIHAKIIRHGLSQDQLLVRNMLQLCSSHGVMDYATLVFHQLSEPVTFTWNLMIRALALNGKSQEALLVYNLMISRGFPPDKFTFPFVIKACLASSAIEKGKEVHGLAIRIGFAGDIFLQNTLLDLYFKCGQVKCGCKVFVKMQVRNIVSWTTTVTGLVSCGKLDAAERVFSHMPVRNVVSWTAMITGYVRNQQAAEAFELFHWMQAENVRPNEFTLVSLLKACTQLDSLSMGRLIHDYVNKNGFKLGVFLGTALIDMYGKCGSLKDAKKVFDKMQTRSLATWNSMITSLGVHGRGDEVLALFQHMEKVKVQPDAITFVGVLSACAQIKNVKKGLRYFKHMTEHYGIEPILQHWGCLVELCNHASEPDEICNLMEAMSDCPYPSMVEEFFSMAKNNTVFTTEESSGSVQHQFLCSKWDVG